MFDHGQTALSDAYRRSCIQRRDVKLDRRRLTSRALSRMLNRGDHGISPATVSGCRSTRIRRRRPEPSRWSRSASIFRSRGRVSRAANSRLIPSHPPRRSVDVHRAGGSDRRLLVGAAVLGIFLVQGRERGSSVQQT